MYNTCSSEFLIQKKKNGTNGHYNVSTYTKLMPFYNSYNYITKNIEGYIFKNFSDIKHCFNF